MLHLLNSSLYKTVAHGTVLAQIFLVLLFIRPASSNEEEIFLCAGSYWVFVEENAVKFDELEEQFYFWKFFKLQPRKINVFETLPTVFFCESNLQPVPDCERHYRAGYGSIQFSHNQAEVDLGTMPLYSQIPRNTTSLLRAIKNRSYWKIPELLSIKLSLSRSVGTEKTRHLETLRLSISSSFKMIASGTILTKGFLILLFSQLIFTTAGNYSMFNVIFFFGRLYVYCGSSDIFLFFNDKK